MLRCRAQRAPQGRAVSRGTQQPSGALPDVPGHTWGLTAQRRALQPPHAHSTAQPWAAVTWSSCTLCPTAGQLCGQRKLQVTSHSLGDAALCSMGWEGSGQAQRDGAASGTVPHSPSVPSVAQRRLTASLGAALQLQQSLGGKLGVCTVERKPPGPPALCSVGAPQLRVTPPRAPPALGFYSPPPRLQPHMVSRAPHPSLAALTPHPSSTALWQPQDRA